MNYNTNKKPKKNKFFYRVVSVEIKFGDEYIEFSSTNQKEALRLGKYAFNRMSIHDQKKQIIEVRKYKLNPDSEENINQGWDTIKEFKTK